jgi:hypothetical protein
VAATVMRNAAIPMVCQEEHLGLPVVRVQWPSVRKNDRWAVLRAPDLVIDLRAILDGVVRHLAEQVRLQRQDCSREIVSVLVTFWRAGTQAPSSALTSNSKMATSSTLYIHCRFSPFNSFTRTKSIVDSWWNMN